jgi:hypothetical protein
MQRRWILITGLIAAGMLSVSCGQVRQLTGSLRDLMVVQQALVKDAGQVQVNLRRDGQSEVMNIDLVNSPWRSLPSEEQRSKALEIGRVAYEKYPSRSRLQGIRVTLGLHRTYLGIFHYDNTTDTFGFTIPELTSQLSRAER